MRLSSLLIMAPLFGACVSSTTSHEMRDVVIEPGVTTKEELIRQLGAPRGMRIQGDDTVLRFEYGEVNGTAYGFGSIAMALAVESTHLGVDSLEVIVGPDRIVRSFRLATMPRETPKWPSE